MKVSFFSVAMIAAIGLFEVNEAVPLHTMSTSKTDSGINVNLASLTEGGEAGKPVSFTLGDGDMKTIDLTSSFTPKTSSAPKAKAAGKINSGSQMESALTSLMKETNGLTGALMDKMKADIMGGGPKPCTLQERLDDGFSIAFENFDVDGLVPDCPAPPAPKCECEPKTSTITIAADQCNSCDAKKATVTAPKAATTATTTAPKTAVSATAPKSSVSAAPPTAAKTAPSTAEKTADKADAIKKLEAAKAK